MRVISHGPSPDSLVSSQVIVHTLRYLAVMFTVGLDGELLPRRLLAEVGQRAGYDVENRDGGVRGKECRQSWMQQIVRVEPPTIVVGPVQPLGFEARVPEEQLRLDTGLPRGSGALRN